MALTIEEMRVKEAEAKAAKTAQKKAAAKEKPRSDEERSKHNANRRAVKYKDDPDQRAAQLGRPPVNLNPPVRDDSLPPFVAKYSDVKDFRAWIWKIHWCESEDALNIIASALVTEAAQEESRLKARHYEYEENPYDSEFNKGKRRLYVSHPEYNLIIAAGKERRALIRQETTLEDILSNPAPAPDYKARQRAAFASIAPYWDYTKYHSYVVGRIKYQNENGTWSSLEAVRDFAIKHLVSWIIELSDGTFDIYPAGYAKLPPFSVIRAVFSVENGWKRAEELTPAEAEAFGLIVAVVDEHGNDLESEAA